MRIFRLHPLPACILLLIAPSSVSAVLNTTVTDDGLTIQFTKQLRCTRPTRPGDEVSVHYRGSLQSDGFEFDSSYDRGVPISFTVGAGQVIAGWDEGLLDMCVGDERSLIIPPELGYGKWGKGPIPGGSTLIFETSLVDVVGESKDDTEGHAVVDVSDDAVSEDGKVLDDAVSKDGKVLDDAVSEDGKALDDAVSEDGKALDDTASEDGKVLDELPANEQDDKDQPSATPDDTSDYMYDDDEQGPTESVFAFEKNECRLLGPFALIVQGALGLLALLSLVFKRWRERPRRPLKVWFFDVSKQVVGTFLLHLANLAMSMISSGSFEVQGQEKQLADAVKDASGSQPNPCSFYLLNLAIDTTIGIPVLIVLLKVLTALFMRTPLARPAESIRSGHYGNPPRGAWWMKQSLIYFMGLLGMKLCVLFLFQALPWLGWVGDWALRWTEGNEALQIAFVMFVFPVCMNAIQYYIVDSIIMGHPEGDDDDDDADGTDAERGRFERIAQDDVDDDDDDHDDDDDDEIDGEGIFRRRVGGAGVDDDSETVVVLEDDGDSKKAGVKTKESALAYIEPDALSEYSGPRGDGSSK